MIYLDNAATTKMYEEGADLYKEYACHSFFNPSAGYKDAVQVKIELDGVRKLILKRLGLNSGDVIFTGGATESNNLAINGSKRNGSKYEFVFSSGEHKSVLNVAKELEKQGNKVHFINLNKNGQIDYDELKKVLNENTRLISAIHVSNETGAINYIKRIVDLRNKFAKNALVHIDGVQAFCKLDFSLQGLGVDFYTLSAHKFHGPKGVGALYVRNLQGLKPIVFGGGQENGIRSGTENIPGIMAMKYAIERIDVKQNYEHVQKLNLKMREILSQDKNILMYEYFGSPYILSAEFEGVNGETLIRVLAEQGILVGNGSACSSQRAGNHVLENLGLNLNQIKSHIRISFSELNTLQEIEEAGEKIIKSFEELREKLR